MSRYKRQVNTYLQKFRQGDVKQFDALFETTANHLRVIARKYAVVKSDADDVVSETFIHVYTHIAAFDPDKDGYNWLCKIVQNVAYDFNAVRKKEHDRQVPLKDAITVEQRGASLYEQVTALSDTEQLLQDADETDRRIFYLRFYKNATEREIAQEIGLSNAGVHKRLKKILKKAKEFLQNGKQNP